MTEHLIGVISDTHGLLRPEAVKALKGVELIIHAGDIGNPKICRSPGTYRPSAHSTGQHRPGRIGPRNLPQSLLVEVGGVHLFVLHELFCLDLDPAAAGSAAVIFGHSHSPHQERQNGVIFLNPGSAGPRRFTLPVLTALLQVQNNGLFPEFIDLMK